MSKEIWFKLFESAYNDAIDKGFSTAAANDLAAYLADKGTYDVLADRADRAKDLAKERGEWPPRKS